MNLHDILVLVLPLLTGATSWVVARRKRDNDFIAELQGSIALLSESYNKALEELVEVKKQNALLLYNQEELKIQIETLSKENESMRNLITQLKPTWRPKHKSA